MKVLRRIFHRPDKSNLEFIVVRMSRKNHHFYSILATNTGFEYIFRNGTNHWSTISPSYVKRILEHHLNEQKRPFPTTAKEFLKLAYFEDSLNWQVSKEFNYATRDEALKVEREILDISWATAKEQPDDN